MRKYAVIVFALVFVVAGGAAYAVTRSALTDDGGAFHGCVDNRSGQLRVIQPGEDCDRRETAITWNQTGPQGPAGATGETGPVGPQGPQGPVGPAGSISLETLAGSPCTRSDDSAGSVAVAIAADNSIQLSCGPLETWCQSHTPTVGLHMQVQCNEDTHELTYTCDAGWTDTNDDPADGCENTVDAPTVIGFSNEDAERLSLWLPTVAKPATAVVADCGAAVPVGCTGGTPDSNLPSISIDPAQHPGDLDRTIVVPHADTASFDITQRMRMVASTPIPVTLPVVGTCGLTIDTRVGTTPDVAVDYADSVPADHPAGPTVVGAPSPITGMTLDDVSLTGPAGCMLINLDSAELASIATSLALTLTPWIDDEATFCGAPDVPWYQHCSA